MLSQAQVKVLIIDDDKDDFFIIADLLKDIDGTSFVIHWCNSYEAAIDEINNATYDIYFVDYRLSFKTGLQLLKETRLNTDRPIILLTGKGNKEIDIEAMKSGAIDYMVKSDLSAEKLERSIRYSLERSASLRIIKENKNKYESLFTGSKDALFIADRHLLLKEVNQSAAKLLGYSAAELHNRDLYDFIADKTSEIKIKDALEAHEDIYDVEIEIANRDGDTRTCALSILKEINSAEQGLVHGIIHDITHIKKAEEINLLSAKLAASERLLRILAHEIRNPLNNIQLSADHLNIMNSLDDNQAAMVNIIQRNTTRINEMITELLESTKTLEIVFERHALQDVVEESLCLAVDRISLQNISLCRVFFPEPLYILGDKTKLQIAFSNILINAIEAMESHKGELHVTVAELPEAYRVSIRDNGKGIPREHLSKVFDPFFTLKQNGMGLGLSAAYSIFKSHKAKVAVQSVPDQGTTFLMDFHKVVNVDY